MPSGETVCSTNTGDESTLHRSMSAFFRHNISSCTRRTPLQPTGRPGAVGVLLAVMCAQVRLIAATVLASAVFAVRLSACLLQQNIVPQRGVQGGS